MNFVVFDLEWNMANPWDKIDADKKARMPYEIIEIGAVKLSETGEDLGHFNVRIKPVLYRKLNRHVEKVTHMTQLSLNTGYLFKQAIAGFWRFCGEDYCLCSWSDSDAEPLKRNLEFHGFSSDLGVRVLDVQRAFTALVEPGEGQRNVEYALDLLKLPKNEPFHKALSDARYTGKVLARLLTFGAEDGLSVAEFVHRFSYNPDMNLRAAVRLPVSSTVAEAEGFLSALAFECPHCGAALVADVSDVGVGLDSGVSALGVVADFASDSGVSVSNSASGLPSSSTVVSSSDLVSASSVAPPWSLAGKTYRSSWRCPEHGAVAARCRLRKGREGKWLGTVNLQILES